ncbi:hypothetical protein SAMN04487764_1963 [Gillisia sp. Hel1_33_143]|uniref:hypothetical protein n=1 Tax=unclassified Gillisia TaxID=2615025 RepID=UPI0005533D52|nr:MULTISPECIES: hypothetical protein [unclassified Gillisia]SDS32605.1 hypothetical protein SAMN04487764_1963 [Gillisia sp. Hel1_33_143]
MSIEIIRLLLDFGLLVLIWIIQRIVYPSFAYYSPEKLVNWHTAYTKRFSTIVIPLMFGQLGIAFYQLITQSNFYTIISLLTIAVIWISTFGIFVPIHSKIAKNNGDQKMLTSLVKKNWIRTVLWSFLFIYSLLEISF